MCAQHTPRQAALIEQGWRHAQCGLDAEAASDHEAANRCFHRMHRCWEEADATELLTPERHKP